MQCGTTRMFLVCFFLKTHSDCYEPQQEGNRKHSIAVLTDLANFFINITGLTFFFLFFFFFSGHSEVEILLLNLIVYTTSFLSFLHSIKNAVHSS